MHASVGFSGLLLHRRTFTISVLGPSPPSLPPPPPCTLLFSVGRTREAADYAFHLICINILLLVLGLRKWIQEDLSSKAAGAFEKVTGKFAKACLCIWDHSLSTAQDADNLQVRAPVGLRLLGRGGGSGWG